MKCLISRNQLKFIYHLEACKLKETNIPATRLLTKMHINCGKIQIARPIPDLFEILDSILFKKQTNKNTKLT